MEDFSWPAMSELRNKRGDAFNNEGMYQFFTSSPTKAKKFSLLTPSLGDVTEVLGNRNYGTQVNINDTIDIVAIRDSISWVQHTCHPLLMNRDAEDNSLRIFDCMYNIIKACIPLSINSSVALLQGGRNHVALKLESRVPSSALFVLLRPLFIRVSGSSVFAVNILHSNFTDDASTNTMIDYDSSKEADLHVLLTRVTDCAVAPDVKEINDRYLTVGHSKLPTSDVASVFFLRKNDRELPMKQDDLNRGKVLTLYFTMPKTFEASSKRIFELKSIKGLVTIDVGLQNATDPTIGVFTIRSTESDASSVVIVEVELGALVVVVFSSDLLLACMMHPKRIIYKSIVLPNEFDMRTYGGSDIIVSSVALAHANTPTGLTPYDNTSIPDLADISTRMRVYPTLVYK